MTALAEHFDYFYTDVYEVSRESVRAYARAVRDPYVASGPLVHVPDDSPVPLTLLGSPMLAAQEKAVRDLVPNCNMSRLLHVEQRFSYPEKVRIGNRLSFGVRVLSRVDKGGVALIQIEVSAVRVSDGVIVLVAHTTLAYSPETADDGAPSGMDELADQVMQTSTGPSAAGELDAADRALAL